MLKLTTILCGALFLAMLIGGRDQGQVRYGLEGRIPSLKVAIERHETPDTEIAANPAPHKAVRPAAVAPVAVVQPASLETMVDGAQPEPVVSASYESNSQDALSGTVGLAMPLVQPGSEAAADTTLPPEDAGGVIAYISGSTVNVRSGPSAQSAAVGRLDRGESVLVLPSDTPGWSKIRIEGDGIEGYVASRFLSQQTAESGPSGD